MGLSNGEAIVANRYEGARYVICWNIESAHLARQHNDANMLALGQRLLDLETAITIAEHWLVTPFEDDERGKNEMEESDDILKTERRIS